MARLTRLFSCLALSLCLALGATGCGGEDEQYGDLTLRLYCGDGYSNTYTECNLLQGTYSSRILIYANDVLIVDEEFHWTQGNAIQILDLLEGSYGYEAWIYAMDGVTPLYYVDSYEYDRYLSVYGGENNDYEVYLHPYY